MNAALLIPADRLQQLLSSPIGSTATPLSDGADNRCEPDNALS
jgi:hypothetical protein